MIYTAENEMLVMKVNSMGAELCSIVEKNSGMEYMWSGDKTVWSGISPVLFPFIGGLQKGGYTYEGRRYTIGKHGFARGAAFTCTEQKENALWFSLEDSEETREVYPFAFLFEAGYVLEGRTIQVKWRVKNRNNKTMYFALGGHPAIVCPPPYQAGNRTECSILFEEKGAAAKESIISELIGSDGLVSGKQREYKLQDGLLPVTTGLFDIDTLVLDNSQVTAISLCDKEKKPYVTVSFDTPTVSLWSMQPDDVSYICIEPWYGRCDNSGYAGTLEERPWGRALSAGECFEAGYEIKIWQ